MTEHSVKQIVLLPGTAWTREVVLTICTTPTNLHAVGVHASADRNGVGFLVSRVCRVWCFTI